MHLHRRGVAGESIPASSALLLDDGRAPKASDPSAPRYKPMPAKAKMLKRLAQAGYRDFYEGEVAAMIAGDLEAGGSKIRKRDLAKFQPRWQAPLKGSYRNFEVNAVPGLSGGPSFLDAAQRLSKSGINAKSTPGEAALAYATAIRDAYEVRLTTLGHAAMKDAGCTSHLSVVDRHGTMVALTNTLLSRFGSHVALPNAGMLMNNGMMWFDPRPNQPNSIAPGAQPLGQHVPAGADARRQAGARDRRGRRANHLPDGAATRLLSRRFRVFRSKRRFTSRASMRRRRGSRSMPRRRPMSPPPSGASFRSRSSRTRCTR